MSNAIYSESTVSIIFICSSFAGGVQHVAFLRQHSTSQHRYFLKVESWQVYDFLVAIYYDYNFLVTSEVRGF